MIEIRFEEREKIGLQYILESLHGCSPFGQERIRRLLELAPGPAQSWPELAEIRPAAFGVRVRPRPRWTVGGLWH